MEGPRFGYCTNAPNRCFTAAARRKVPMTGSWALCPDCGSTLATQAPGALRNAAILAVGAGLLAALVAALAWFAVTATPEPPVATGAPAPAAAPAPPPEPAPEPAPARLAAPVPAAPAAARPTLRLAADRPLATTLAPALVRTWLNAEGATGIVELRQTGPDLRPGADTVIGAHLAAARVSIEIDGTLPKAGFAALAAGTTDLVLTAGPDAAGDIAPLQAAGGPVAEHLLGYAAVAVIVPRSSRIGTLSIADVARLFDGTAASQAPFGGPPGGVALYAPPEEDPAEALFRALVMPAAPLARNRRVADPVTLDRLVAADPRAIGIVGPHAIHESRAVALGEANALPTDDEIRRGRYPLARPIRLYAQSAPASPAIRQFVAIAVSGAGQLTVAEAGLVAPGP